MHMGNLTKIENLTDVKAMVVRGYAMSGYFMAIGLTDWLGEERTCYYIGVEVEKPNEGVQIFPLELWRREVS